MAGVRGGSGAAWQLFEKGWKGQNWIRHNTPWVDTVWILDTAPTLDTVDTVDAMHNIASHHHRNTQSAIVYTGVMDDSNE